MRNMAGVRQTGRVKYVQCLEWLWGGILSKQTAEFRVGMSSKRKTMCKKSDLCYYGMKSGQCEGRNNEI